MRHSNPHETSTEHSDHCDNLLLVTFWPSDILLLRHLPLVWYIQETKVHSPLKVGSFVIRTTAVFLPGLWQDVHFCSEAKCVCFVTCHGVELEVFWLVWRKMDEMSQWLKSGLDDGTYWRMDQFGMCPNLWLSDAHLTELHQCKGQCCSVGCASPYDGLG